MSYSKVTEASDTNYTIIRHSVGTQFKHSLGTLRTTLEHIITDITFLLTTNIIPEDY